MFQIHAMEIFVALLVLILNTLPIALSIWVLLTVRRFERRVEIKLAEIQQLLQSRN